ncbi:MAG: hypothetical protein VYB98_04620, partial [Actinomycetota bacterium]|nr:hypothetical protein [Actinomycetota bacterium]
RVVGRDDLVGDTISDISGTQDKIEYVGNDRLRISQFNGGNGIDIIDANQRSIVGSTDNDDLDFRNVTFADSDQVIDADRGDDVV